MLLLLDDSAGCKLGLSNLAQESSIYMENRKQAKNVWGKQIEKVWMLRERKDFDPKGFWLDLLKSHLEKKGRQTNEKCRYCLKPNIKTTCFEWNGDGAESCISMHLMIAFVKLLLLSSYERCSLKIAQEVCLLRLTFSLLFSSDFRRPRALRYRQARGWGRGENISDRIFLAKLSLLCLLCGELCEEETQ